MPTPLTGTASDPTTSPTATGPTAGDPASASVILAAFQAFLNYIAWLRGHVALLTGATFTGAVNGITPTADAHLTRRDYVVAADAAILASANAHTDGIAALYTARVRGSDGVILAARGSLAVSLNSHSLGSYVFNVPGVTANAIVLASINGTSAKMVRQSAITPGSLLAFETCYTTSGASENCDFCFSIVQL